MPAAPLLLARIKATARCQGGQTAVGGRGRCCGRRMMVMVGKEGKMRGGSGGHTVLLLMAVVVGAGPGREGAAVAAAVAGGGGGGRVHGALALPAVRVQLLLLVRQNLIIAKMLFLVAVENVREKIYCTVLPHFPPKPSYGPWKLM
jgi:hypothetical protein